MANSLNDLAKNSVNLSQTYDNSSAVPSVKDNLNDLATILGYGADLPNGDSSTDVELGGNMARFAQHDTEWDGYRRQRDTNNTDELDLPSNQFIALITADFDATAYRDDTRIYKNNTLSTTIDAGESGSVGCVAGDLVYVTRPVAQSTGTQFDEGFLYMGWAGYCFTHRRDRNSGATLFLVALQSQTSYEIRYTTSDGAVSSTVEQSTGTITNGYDLTNAGTILSTRNYVITSDKPMCAYVRLISGGGVNDSLPLYPTDQDAKYGAFSAGGHIFLLNNVTQKRAGSNVTQTLFTRSSNGGTTTERNASTAMGTMYIDLSPGQTSGTFFTGPVQKIQSGSGSLIGAEQQADGNGSEMTPFVSQKAFGTIGGTNAGTPAFVCCIGIAAIVVRHRNKSGNLIASQTMAGSSTYNIYFTRFTANLSNDDIFETPTSSGFILYFDNNTTLNDERTCFMGDTTLEMSSLYQTANISGPYGNEGEACNGGEPSSTHYIVKTFAQGEQVFTDAACTTELADGSDYWYNHDTNERFQYTSWTPTTGGIENIVSCGR
jgi:hypothetical protein